TRSGLDLTVPYYLNLAPNYDLTLIPRYLSKRGVQLGADARYVDYFYEGQARLEYMPNDDMLNRSRYAYRFDHRHNLGGGLSAVVNWNGVSVSPFANIADAVAASGIDRLCARPMAADQLAGSALPDPADRSDQPDCPPLFPRAAA
ncbi:MAG: hypothetical protein MK097_04245, partial [Dechloromonas sp.]|nr:hypothetical protein [Dechloromonas sp.]